MGTLGRFLIWQWSWLCWLAIMTLPYQFAYSRLGLALLPWAGVYGFNEGGRAEFMANGLQGSITIGGSND